MGRAPKKVMPAMRALRLGSAPGGMTEPATDDSTSAKMFTYATSAPALTKCDSHTHHKHSEINFIDDLDIVNMIDSARQPSAVTDITSFLGLESLFSESRLSGSTT